VCARATIRAWRAHAASGGFFACWCRRAQELLPRHAYDVILTAETIYNVNSLPRLFALIKHCLKPPHGVWYAIDTERPLFFLLVSLPRLASLRVVSRRARSRSYVAAKSYYFSVGGGCRQFEEMVNRDGLLETSVEKVIKGAYHHHHHHMRSLFPHTSSSSSTNQMVART
jgi:hypothetical protein